MNLYLCIPVFENRENWSDKDFCLKKYAFRAELRWIILKLNDFMENSLCITESTWLSRNSVP
jgi:hypothetical protein